jgi:general secretion pathway protein A
MYETHFGFHRQPFHSADASRAFFVSESIQTIRPQLLHALRSDLGIAVLTGVPGSGKTSLLRHIQQQLSNEGRAIMCSGACLGTSAELLGVLLHASRMKAGSEKEVRSVALSGSSLETRSAILDQTKRTAELWGPVLLLIDDAHLVPLPVLNELRAFTEEEWNGRDLVRCLVSAPVSFEEQLARSEYAEFGRRIRCHAFLQPLKSRESIRFLNEHIELAGGRLSDVFTAAALELIAAAADGIPRCLSLLADESLVVAMETGEKIATETSARAALGRLQHLQYNWNASPHTEVDEGSDTESQFELDFTDSQDTDNSVESESSTKESPRAVASPVTTSGSKTPAQTTLAPGVIEFGGSSARVPGTESAQLIPETVSDTIEIASDLDSDVNNVPSALDDKEILNRDEERLPSEKPNSTASCVVEFGEPQEDVESIRESLAAPPVEKTAAFEVGRRFFAESSADSVSIEDVNDCEITELLSVEYASDSAESGNGSIEEFDADDTSLWTVDSEIHWIDGNEGASKLTSPDRNPQDDEVESGDDEPLMLASEEYLSPASAAWEDIDNSSKQTSHDESPDFVAAQLSNPTPVFDRYTWIALGREVPHGLNSTISASTKELIRAEHGVPAADQAADAWGPSFYSVPKASVNPISISQTTDCEIMDHIRKNSLFTKMESPATAHRKPDTDCQASESPDLKIWQDGQLIFAKSNNDESSEVPVSNERSATANFTSPPIASVQADSDEFFTLPVPMNDADWDLRSIRLEEDRDLRPIAETLTRLCEDVLHFQQSTESVASDSAAEESCIRPPVDAASDSDSLILQAKQRLNESTCCDDSTVVALQIAPEARSLRSDSRELEVASRANTNLSSAPQFSRLFTRLWENRRQATGQADSED